MDERMGAVRLRLWWNRVLRWLASDPPVERCGDCADFGKCRLCGGCLEWGERA